MVDLCLLGCGGGMPMVDRYLSAGFINYEGKKILIDCGEGTQVSMRILGWGFKKIDVICITHIHGDHIVGLPGLLATIGNSGRVEPITIIGPEGIEIAITGLRTIAPYLPYEINIIENPKNLKVLENNISIETLELDHSSPCIGYSFNIKRKPKFDVNKALQNNVPKILWNRLQKGEAINLDGKIYNPNLVLGKDRKGIKISYITDTRPIESIKEFIKKSDLFICEGTYGSSDDLDKAIKNKHMTFKEAALLAKDGEVKELLLTHFSPALINPNEFIDEAKNTFQNTIVGYDRIVKVLNYVDE